MSYFNVGDIVTLTRTYREGDPTKAFPAMASMAEAFVGKECMVTSVDTGDYTLCIEKNEPSRSTYWVPMYLCEKVKQPKPTKPYGQRQKEWIESNNLHEGSHVRVVKKVEEESGWTDYWVHYMDKFIGEICTIGDYTNSYKAFELSKDNQNGIVVVHPDGLKYKFPYTALEPVPEELCLKATDFVLCRDYPSREWVLDIFSHENKPKEETYRYKCLHHSWDYCIPYKGNEHLLNKEG